MLAPIREQLTALAATLTLHPPQIPYISNVTGTWITAEQATDPAYWAHHLRKTVRFAEGIDTILQEPRQILLEVGPGRTLSTFARQQPKADGRIVLASLRHEGNGGALAIVTTAGAGTADLNAMARLRTRFGVTLVLIEQSAIGGLCAA